MKDFIITAMTAAIVSGVVRLLSPKGAVKKQISLVCSLSVCAILFISITAALKQENISLSLNLPNNTGNEASASDAQNEIADNTAAVICRELEERLRECCGVSSPRVVLTLDKSDFSSVKICSAVISGDGVGSDEAEFIREILGCDVFIGD